MAFGDVWRTPRDKHVVTVMVLARKPREQSSLVLALSESDCEGKCADYPFVGVLSDKDMLEWTRVDAPDAHEYHLTGA